MTRHVFLRSAHRAGNLRALAAAVAGAAAVVAAAGVAVPTAGAVPASRTDGLTSRTTFHDDELFGVSCTKKGCLAAGKWFDSAAESTKPLAEHGTGASWVLDNPPIPKGSTITAVNSVSCVSAPTAECMVVGQWGTLKGSNNYAALWNWSSWKLLTTPNAPSSALDQLNSVSCVSSRYCVTTGHSVSTSSHRGQTESLVWNGSKWTPETVPQLIVAGITDQWLYGVSCVSTTFCLAVGDYDINSGGSQPNSAATWNGSKWTTRTAQSAPGAKGNSLLGVSCLTSTNCQAVGNYLTAKLAFGAVAEGWDGKSVTLEPVPQTGPKSAGSDLTDVSCRSASFCVATGNESALWNGKSWTSKGFPRPSKVLTIAYATSCVTAIKCTAVGDYVSGENALTFIVNWNGTTWTQRAGQNP
jgi:hypothetical protein